MISECLLKYVKKSTINKLSEITTSPAEKNITIILILERYYNDGELKIKCHDSGTGWTFMSIFAWKSSVNTSNGVAWMFLSVRALISQNNIEKIQPRMTHSFFDGFPNATIVSYYIPTNACDEKDIITSHNALPSFIQHSQLQPFVHR